MAMLRAVCVVLACVLVHVDCFRGKRDEDCEALVQCQTPLQTYITEHDNQPSNYGIANEAAMDEFCNKVEEAKICLERVGSDCDSDSVNAEVSGTQSGVDYVCSEEGKEEILGMAQSECVSNEAKMQEATDDMQKCVETFEFNLLMLAVGAMSEERQLEHDEMCPYADAWVDCTIDVARDVCGKAYGRFIARVLSSSVGKQFESMGCMDTFTLKHEALKRHMAKKRWLD